MWWEIAVITDSIWEVIILLIFHDYNDVNLSPLVLLSYKHWGKKEVLSTSSGRRVGLGSHCDRVEVCLEMSRLLNSLSVRPSRTTAATTTLTQCPCQSPTSLTPFTHSLITTISNIGAIHAILEQLFLYVEYKKLMKTRMLKQFKRL